jgi:primosomal protein N'
MVNGNFRMQIILRGKKMTPLLETAKRLVWGYRPPKNVYIEVDVDPVNML